MEFAFNINRFLPEVVTVVTANTLRTTKWPAQLDEVIDRLGLASCKVSARRSKFLLCGVGVGPKR